MGTHQKKTGEKGKKDREKGGQRSSPAAACRRASPDVVVPAEDHAALGVAGGADVPQLGLAAGALEAAAVPVAVHGIEQEAVGDLPPAAGAPLPREGARRHRGRLRAAAGVHHGLRGERGGGGSGTGRQRRAPRPPPASPAAGQRRSRARGGSAAPGRGAARGRAAAGDRRAWGAEAARPPLPLRACAAAAHKSGTVPGFVLVMKKESV